MRIKLDENLPARLAAILTNLRHDVHTITDENLSGKSDREVGTLPSEISGSSLHRTWTFRM